MGREAVEIQQSANNAMQDPNGNIRDDQEPALSTNFENPTNFKRNSDDENDDNSLQCKQLLTNVKQAVKQLMEQAATKSVLHINSSAVLVFCVYMDACLSHKLKRRALGLFKSTSSTCKLIRKISKCCDSANWILLKLEEEKKKSIKKNQQTSSNSLIFQTSASNQACCDNRSERNNWIRLSLIEKKLIDIIDYLEQNSNKYYEKDSFMTNSLYTQIVKSLLVGVGTLDIKLEQPLEQWKYDSPTAEDLLNRRRLARPVACLSGKDCSHFETTDIHKSFSSSMSTLNTNESPEKNLKNSMYIKQRTLPIMSSTRRRRSLALNTCYAEGVIVTECHHYSCQQLSEHQQTRGYSLICAESLYPQSTNQTPAKAIDKSMTGNKKSWLTSANEELINNYDTTSNLQRNWSPKLLHETLHQNSSSLLIYAKNNIYLETNGETIIYRPGYLSLHETFSPPDVILKWIPNHLINFGHQNSVLQTDDRKEQEKANESSPVDSSSLDQIIYFSMSKVVLLHCKLFLGINTREPDKDTIEADAENIESVTMLECDGVQRAPFKFPVGGVKLFLSCLDNGLRVSQNRCLSPTIWLSNPQANATYSPTSITHYGLDTSHSCHKALEISNLDQTVRIKSEENYADKDKANNGEVASTSTDGQIVNLVFQIISSENTGKINTKFLSSTESTATQNSAITGTSSSITSEPDSGSIQSASITSSFDTHQHTQKRQFRWSLKRLARFSNNSSASTSSSSQSNIRVFDENKTLNDYHSNQTTFDSLARISFNLEVDKHDDQNGHSNINRIERKLEDLSEHMEIAGYASVDQHILRGNSEKPVSVLCERMKKQIIARAFYGWLTYCKKLKLIRIHLSDLIYKRVSLKSSLNYFECEKSNEFEIYELQKGLTRHRWKQLTTDHPSRSKCLRREVALFVYHGGIEDNELRRIVWPYLLGLYKYNKINHIEVLESHRIKYKNAQDEWQQVAKVVESNDARLFAENLVNSNLKNQSLKKNNDMVEDNLKTKIDLKSPSDDQLKYIDYLAEKNSTKIRRRRLESHCSLHEDSSIADIFGNDLHRIEKDVQRCDRNHIYFKNEKNLDRLRQIMCTYVWLNLDHGYVQGMCDLAAPILVLFSKDDENDDNCLWITLACYSQLMKRCINNFPKSSTSKHSYQESRMAKQFESLRYLIQVFDPKLFETLLTDDCNDNTDLNEGTSPNQQAKLYECFYHQLYFCYRWLLLDFKREFKYEHLFMVWETIWAARNLTTSNFVVFIAFALIRHYRDIIIENKMDYTDTIRFFNEMAERHEASKVLDLARDCVIELNSMLNNKSYKPVYVES